MQTDKERLIATFKKIGLKGYKIFKKEEFICEEAVSFGAAEALSLNDFDFNFDKKGRMVGTNTQGIHSFVARNKKR